MNAFVLCISVILKGKRKRFVAIDIDKSQNMFEMFGLRTAELKYVHSHVTN